MTKKGLPSRESWQKHTDDSHLYNTIRYHSKPFARPPATSSVKDDDQDKLVREVENKFHSGDHRFANFVSQSGAIVKPIFLFLTLPFYLCFRVLPVLIKELGSKLSRPLLNRQQLCRNAIMQKYGQVQNAIATRFSKISAILNGKMQICRQWYKSRCQQIKEAVAKFHPKNLVLQLQAKVQFLYEWPKLLSERCRSLCEKLLQKRNAIVSSIEKLYFSVKSKIVGAIASPIKTAQQAYQRIYQQCITAPKTYLQNISDRVKSHLESIYQKIEALWQVPYQRYVQIKQKIIDFYQSKLALIENWRLVQLSKLQKRFEPMQQKVQSYAKPLHQMQERIEFVKKQLHTYRQRVRAEAIALPGKLENNFPFFLEKLKGYLESVQKWYELQVTARLDSLRNSLKGLIPKPLIDGYQYTTAYWQKGALQVSTRYQKISNVISGRYEAFAFNLLILRIWGYVLWNYGLQMAAQKAQSYVRNTPKQLDQL